VLSKELVYVFIIIRQTAAFIFRPLEKTRNLGAPYSSEALTPLPTYKTRKVVGSIPDGVSGIFHSHNCLGRTMAQGLTHPLTEMSIQEYFLGGG
jgi:hypothetical protein